MFLFLSFLFFSPLIICTTNFFVFYHLRVTTIYKSACFISFFFVLNSLRFFFFYSRHIYISHKSIHLLYAQHCALPVDSLLQLIWRLPDRSTNIATFPFRKITWVSVCMEPFSATAPSIVNRKWASLLQTHFFLLSYTNSR